MKKTVIVDIDGTLSKVGDRLKYLTQNPPDWDAFYNACFQDEPIKEICKLVDDLDTEGYKLIFCTGRRESVRDLTMIWLGKHVVLWNDSWLTERLLMRPDGDTRHDTEVKPEQLELAGIKLEDIAFVLEDRNSMVKKWREMGLICLQVAEGDF